jgi:hypothetical protein
MPWQRPAFALEVRTTGLATRSNILVTRVGSCCRAGKVRRSSIILYYYNNLRSEPMSNIKVGEIRLIRNLGRKALVVANWFDGRWVVSPASPHVGPLVQGEFLTEEFGVFQLWNTRIFEGDKFAQMTDLVGCVPDKVSKDVYDVFMYIITGSPALTPELVSRIGPPILEHEDPRVEYQDRETRIFNRFLSLS